MSLATNDPKVPQAIKEDSERVLRGIPGIASAACSHRYPGSSPRRAGRGGATAATHIEGVKHVDRHRQRQGGRRQEHRGCESRRRPGSNRRSRGPVRLRHVRPEHRADVRRQRPADGHGAKPHHPDHTLRREIDVHGFPPRRGFPGDPARPDGDALHAAIPAAGGLGRAGFPHSGSASRHGRYPTDHRPDRGAGRCCHRHHAAGGGADRRPQGSRRCSTGSTSPSWASSRT